MDTKRYVVANLSFGVENISTLNALLDPAAEAGHLEAQFNVGLISHTETGVQNKVRMKLQKGMLFLQC